MSLPAKFLIPFVLAFGLTLFPACVAPEGSLEPRELDYARPLEPGENALIRIDPDKYPEFELGIRDRAALLGAVERSLDYMAKPSSKRHFPVEGISHERALRSLEAFRELLVDFQSVWTFSQKLREKFDVYMSVGCDRAGTVLYTGYCEPVIWGNKRKTDRFKYPLYRLPDDLVKTESGATLGRRLPDGKLVPFYTRREIDEGGALKDRGLELAYVEHPLDAFIIHVQGSASLKLPDGGKLKIGYAGKNGRPYCSLGQTLIDEGKMDASRLSLDNIRKYFKAHPRELLSYLYKNESYIFFTERDGGPYGSIGVEVTPYHTIATDKSVFPRGAVTFIDTRLPAMDGQGVINMRRYRGFALDQDTGGAIRSAGRVDVFLGKGREAMILAGRTRFEGKLYYLFFK